jgi:hypothetical protein
MNRRGRQPFGTPIHTFAQPLRENPIDALQLREYSPSQIEPKSLETLRLLSSKGRIHLNSVCALNFLSPQWLRPLSTFAPPVCLVRHRQCAASRLHTEN